MPITMKNKYPSDNTINRKINRMIGRYSDIDDNLFWNYNKSNLSIYVGLTDFEIRLNNSQEHQSSSCYEFAVAR